MARSVKEIPTGTPPVFDVEPYRRLVELQKQMIKLAQQNERVRQECSELRQRVATEAATRETARRSLRQKAKKALKQIPGMAAAKSGLVSIINKQPSPC